MDRQRRDSDTGMRRHDRHLHLPQEIIDEILLLLPVKSLLRFRCVAKSWRALISSRRFVKAHLEKSSNDPSFRYHSVITSGHRLRKFPLAPFLSEPPHIIEAVDSHVPMYGRFGHGMTSCNGLACIVIGEKSFILWNPSTRTYKNLRLRLTWKYDRVVAWGFGYVEMSDDYKVFASTNCMTKVYSLKRDSWRMIDCDLNHKKPYHYYGTGTYLGGKLYWLRKLNYGWEIMTFYLENGESGTSLEPPDTLKYRGPLCLGVLDGHICVLSESFEIWVLKQYAVTPSWSKMMTLPYPYYSCIRTFVFRLGNGAILCCDDKETIAIYYPQRRIYERLSVSNLGKFTSVNVLVESLVSLGSDCEAKEPIKKHVI